MLLLISYKTIVSLELVSTIELCYFVDQFEEKSEVGNEIDYGEIVNDCGMFFQRTVLVQVVRDITEFRRALVAK